METVIFQSKSFMIQTLGHRDSEAPNDRKMGPRGSGPDSVTLLRRRGVGRRLRRLGFLVGREDRVALFFVFVVFVFLLVIVVIDACRK